jgi:PleD family two-component response regulator
MKKNSIHRYKSDDVISREQKSNQQQIEKDKAIKRILVVDDERDVSLVIRLVLEESGFKVNSFTDASKALQNFTSGIYDLVIPCQNACDEWI